ncbi:hypothetical protein F383_14452 [Gossypium arboreum]|uniref:Secreted protein n=1 Tax=Gossypium arboreum TaxID=29729 RepID=A0A0B0N8S2_GOSAR|nr:hypothetical protein F383_14452 [Gossypium arboreum]
MQALGFHRTSRLLLFSIATCALMKPILLPEKCPAHIMQAVSLKQVQLYVCGEFGSLRCLLSHVCMWWRSFWGHMLVFTHFGNS